MISGIEQFRPQRLGERCNQSSIDLACANFPELGVEVFSLWREFEGAVIFGVEVSFRPIEKSGFEAPSGTLAVNSILGPGEGPDSVSAVSRSMGQRSHDLRPFARLAGSNLLAVDRLGQVLTWLVNDAADGESESIYLATLSISDLFSGLHEESVDKQDTKRVVRIIDRGFGDLIARSKNIN